MLKYYLMAIEEKNRIAMQNLGFYYQEINDRENMVKYYAMAIMNGQNTILNVLEENSNKNLTDKELILFHEFSKKNIPNAEASLMRLLRGAKDDALSGYIKYIKTNELELDKQKSENINLKEYITELELAPEGPKYKEAKEHFELLSKSS
jgi:hypothetical protein